MSEESKFVPLSDDDLSQRLESQLAALRPPTVTPATEQNIKSGAEKLTENPAESLPEKAPEVVSHASPETAPVDHLFGALLEPEEPVEPQAEHVAVEPELEVVEKPAIAHDALPVTEPLIVSSADAHVAADLSYLDNLYQASQTGPLATPHHEPVSDHLAEPVSEPHAEPVYAPLVDSNSVPSSLGGEAQSVWPQFDDIIFGNSTSE